MKDVRKLKQLKTQLKQAIIDLEVLKLKSVEAQKEYNNKLEFVRRLEQQIQKLSIKSEGKIKVSEHAILRYFERVLGYDISEIEKKIISEEIEQQIEILGGSGKFPNGDFSIQLRDYTVVTII